MSTELFENILGLPRDTLESGLLLNTSSKEAASRIKMSEVLEGSPWSFLQPQQGIGTSSQVIAYLKSFRSAWRR